MFPLYKRNKQSNNKKQIDYGNNNKRKLQRTIRKHC